MKYSPRAEESAKYPGIFGQKILLEKLGKILYSSIPLGFDSVVFKVRTLAPWGQASMDITRADGSAQSATVADNAMQCAGELRANMYRDGLGTWFSAEFTVTAAGSLHTTYNYDDEPNWTRPAEAVFYVDDLERFPRDPEHIPEWLRRQVELAGR
ncbi:hypothetical protein [Cryobacterium roopkundense]|uniref:Uncharacterized protein n=1 Tax=Cryobacterium roopkundense TaxID=1001240 RepID=A0A7W9E5T0_9MICO|nr:hypothetical protein [Cryobacterium roopkundense]MBB5643551.1 hypothetical protein [Cryobacterium roopkundense]